jgi:hypothetical protein
MANTHFPGSSVGLIDHQLTKGKLIRSPYVTTQKFFLLSTFNQAGKTYNMKKTFGNNGITRWNEK